MTTDVAVRSLLVSSGLTPAQLGLLLGVSRNAVHAWENGSRIATRHLTVLAEVARRVGELPASCPDSRRDALLAIGADGRSLFGRWRTELAPATEPINGSPLTTTEMLGA